MQQCRISCLCRECDDCGGRPAQLRFRYVLVWHLTPRGTLFFADRALPETARKHNIRVVVKSSGHDFQGRSQAPGALSIWVHHMQSLETHEAFKPKGCNFTIDSPAVTVGGGSQLGLIQDELDKINRTIVGGNSKTVSVGGYLTAGGHSILAPRYGLGADSVLELEVVTPLGDIVTANECQNEDLFWAMRGVSFFQQKHTPPRVHIN